MIVECTECHARFKVDPSKLGTKKEVRVRCAKCKAVFPISAASIAAETPTPSVESVIAAGMASAPPPTTVSAPPAPKPVEEPPPTPKPTTAGAPKAPSPEDIFTIVEDRQAKQIVTSTPDTKADPWAALGEGDPFSSLKGLEKASVPDTKRVAKIGLQKTDPESLARSKEKEKEREKERPKDPTPPPVKAPPRIARPLDLPFVPPKQRLLRAGIVTLVVAAGLLLGLGAIGVRPRLTDLKLLANYGRTRVPAGFNLLHYEGWVSAIAPGKKRLFVAGDLFNQAQVEAPAPQLRLEVFSPDGEYIARTIMPCCEVKTLPAMKVVPFTAQIDLSSGVIGGYKVSLEKGSTAEESIP